MDLFFEDIGSKSNPALLYLHGGPGTGSYDFTLFQRDRLANYVRLIALDQRGVLRSPAIGENEQFGLGTIIDDLEQLRLSLHIEQWSLLGHSFGGYLAVAYANAHPKAVNKIILENSSLDLGDCARGLLQQSAMEYATMGRREDAVACLDAAYAPETLPTPVLWETFTELTNNLGEARNNLYVHAIEKDFFERLVEESPLSDVEWGKAGRHQQKLFEEGRVFDSLLDNIPDHPALLLKGRFDPVLTLHQIHTYVSQNPRAELRVFEDSAHFPHAEEPDKFAAEVIEFLCRDK